jgi:hypothetical protein
MRNAYNILVGKPEGKKPFGRLRHRWEDHIMLDFRRLGCEGVEWINLAQDTAQRQALVNMLFKLQIP